MTRTLICVAVLFAGPMTAAAHDGKPHQLSDLVYTWAFDPLIIFLLVVSAIGYIVGIARLWRSAGIGRGVSLWAASAFATAWLSMVVALISPLHPLGEVLFSAHMTQHEILMLVSAPLFVLGRSWIAMLWAMPARGRQSLKDLLDSKPIASAWPLMSNGFAAWLIHAAALWIWHIPALFQATLTSNVIHTLQHASFFLTALLFWWAIISAKGGAAAYGAGVLYLFTTSIHSGVLGAFLTFTRTVWYPAYSATAPSWGMSPIEDQQLGGLIMWVPAGLIYIIAALIMVASWLRESEKRVVVMENAGYSEVKG